MRVYLYLCMYDIYIYIYIISNNKYRDIDLDALDRLIQQIYVYIDRDKKVQ